MPVSHAFFARTPVRCANEPSSVSSRQRRASTSPTTRGVSDAGVVTRRDAFLLGSLLTVVTTTSGRSFAMTSDDDDTFDESAVMDAPPAPAAGDCADCVGEYNGYLNSCQRDADSCVSSQNDDAKHFTAPWSYEGGDRTRAMERLVAVATGVEAPRGRAGNDSLSRAKRLRDSGEAPNAMTDENGFDRAEVANFIVGTTRAFVTGEELPDRPTRAGAIGSSRTLSFAARVDEFDEAKGYVRLALAPRKRLEGDDNDAKDALKSGVFDAEFLFLENDEVVDVRVAQRGGTSGGVGKFQLSYTDGIKYETNLARARAEELRIAVGWELIPVIAAFDPKWSDKEQLWFEKIFDAASGRRAPSYSMDDMRDVMSYDAMSARQGVTS